MITIVDGKIKNFENNHIYGFKHHSFDIVNIAQTTGKIFKKTKHSCGAIACLINQKGVAVFKKDDEIKTITVKKGVLIVIGADIRKKIQVSFPDNTEILYETSYLPDIYLTTKKRCQHKEKIVKAFKDIKKKKDWNQCLIKELELSFIGKGSFGNVFKYDNFSRTCAIKVSKVKPEAIEDKECDSWHELYFLRNAIKNLIVDSICPNFPLIYEDFTCKSCELTTFQGDKIETPTCSMAIELANGTLKQYIQENKTPDELDSALFQIMAALHSMQMYHQLLNYDIKKENILFYDVLPGGYWKYTILGEDYYVPNYGKLFVLNDFGLARSTSPQHVMFIKDKDYSRLGRRYAVIKDDKFIPFSSSCEGDGKKITWSNGSQTTGIEFKLNKTNNICDCNVEIKRDLLRELGLPESLTLDFFQKPEIIPPFEFYNDTQDLIRSFIGGKRATQKGNHKKCKEIPKEFEEKLLPYVGECEMIVDPKLKLSIEPCFVLASQFIKKYFVHYKMKPEKGKIISSYKIS